MSQEAHPEKEDAGEPRDTPTAEEKAVKDREPTVSGCGFGVERS